MNPLISVIIPTYQRCERLKFALSSVLSQTYNNYEIILQWNRSLRFALAVCTLKDKLKNEI